MPSSVLGPETVTTNWTNILGSRAGSKYVSTHLQVKGAVEKIKPSHEMGFSERDLL